MLLALKKISSKDELQRWNKGSSIHVEESAIQCAKNEKNQTHRHTKSRHYSSQSHTK